MLARCPVNVQLLIEILEYIQMRTLLSLPDNKNCELLPRKKIYIPELPLQISP
jgi:hypothetical protein